MIDIRRVFLIAVCLFLLMSMCACSAGQIFLPEKIHKDVSFVSGGITVKGALSYSRGQDMTFTVSEPENISGTVFTDDEVSFDDVKINYGKMKDNSPVNILLMIISDISETGIEIPRKGEYTYVGEGYKINFDCETSEIKSIVTDKYTYNFE